MRLAEYTVTISGEISFVPQGTVVLLLRFSGCNLKCPWCDTAKTQDFKYGKFVLKDDLCKIIESTNKKYGKMSTILVTGGEPLLHDSVIDFIYDFSNEYKFIIETNGTVNIPIFNDNVCVVMDVKPKILLSEVEYEKTVHNIKYRRKNDFLKLIALDEDSLKYQLNMIKQFFIDSEFKPSVFISSVYKQLSYEKIFNLIKELKLAGKIGINTQIHKYINFS